MTTVWKPKSVRRNRRVRLTVPRVKFHVIPIRVIRLTMLTYTPTHIPTCTRNLELIAVPAPS